MTLSAAAHGETYYVRNGGNDDADGRSHAAAWATLQKVNAHSLKPGDKVLLHEGDVFSGTMLTVDWGGTSSQHGVVGAYYVEDGVEKQGLRDSRPVIDGKHEIPDTRWPGLVGIQSDRIRIENLEITNSEGAAIRCDGGRYAQVVNVIVRNTYDAGIRFRKCPDGLIEDNYVTDVARVWREGGDGITSMTKWAASIVIQHWSDRAIVRRNTIAKVFGEGINAHHGTDGALIEENFVFGARAIGIYVDAAPNATVRRNIVVGTSDSRFWREGSRVGPGIAVNNEKFHYEGGGRLEPGVGSNNAVIYANLVANTSGGITFWSNSSTSFNNTLVYNNTLVDNEYQLLLTGSALPNSHFVNNILQSGADSDAKDIGGSTKGLSARNNYFSQGDPGALFSHSENVYGGLQLTRMTGWRDFTEPDEVSWRDFAPKSVSSTIGDGADIDIKAALGPEGSALDFKLKPWTAPVDMGALRKAAGKVPKAPSSFSGRTR